jgi:hypothetical protein
MRLYHQTNNPYSVLPGAPAEYDDVELVLSRTSARSRDTDVVVRIDIPNHAVDRLGHQGKSKWLTTNAELREFGADVACATEADHERAEVYLLAAQRHRTLATIGRLRQYIEDAVDRPSASSFTMMMRAHQDELTDLDNAIADGIRRTGIQHLDAFEQINV